MKETPQNPYVVIVGPTATGKSTLGLLVAAAMNGEILSCDSLQVYREFNIGTAKPNELERKSVPHHLIDVASHSDCFDAAIYARAARKAFDDIVARGKVPVLVGGTGLYLRSFWGDHFDFDLPKNESLRADLANRSSGDLHALLKELDPRRAAVLHPNDKFRLIRAVEISSITKRPSSPAAPSPTPWRRHAYVVYLNPDKNKLRERIRRRVATMLRDDLVGEVKSLLSDGCPETAKPMQSIGYRQVLEFLRGGMTSKQLEEQIYIATCQYAKRQRTWFKKVGVNLELNVFGDEAEFAPVIETLNHRKIPNEYSN
jgi:tRNA dimethylallyltransferase